jgi:hypothetical protein
MNKILKSGKSIGSLCSNPQNLFMPEHTEGSPAIQSAQFTAHSLPHSIHRSQFTAHNSSAALFTAHNSPQQNLPRRIHHEK